MNDKINLNNGVKKTKLEGQIAELKTQEQQITQQLNFWDAKLKKAYNLANYLEAANKFGSQFLTEMVEKEKSKEQPEIWLLECLIKNQFEFTLKFEVGEAVFTKLVLRELERKNRVFKTKLDIIQDQLCHQERKFARLQARRQGKTLLECKLNNGIGCLGSYWCENCQTNYSVPEAVSQLKGGAY